MTTAIVCTALLGVLLFGLGFAVSLTRRSSNAVIGHSDDPNDRLHKIVRAHGNTAEYAPMLAVIMLFLGSRDPSTWAVWTMGIVTASRYLRVAGLLVGPSLATPHPARFVGALGTYLGRLALCVAVLLPP